MKQKLITISIILVLIIITGFEILGLVATNKLADDYKREAITKGEQLTQLKRQHRIDQTAYQLNIKKAQDTQEAQKKERETDIIFGYIIGYLSGINDKKTLNDPELPEFAMLTVLYSQEFGFSPFEALNICQVENQFDLHTPGKAGEQGPAQLMKNTWNEYYSRLGYQAADFYNWKCNYRAVLFFYSDLKKQYNGDIASAIRFYNGGQSWKNNIKTQRYLNRFMIANLGISLLRNRGGIYEISK